MKSLSHFVIDKITNSIEDKATGKTFETGVILISDQEIKKVYKKDGWLFNWQKEYQYPNRQVYKLILSKGIEIQGLLSLEPMNGYIEMHLIENAPHNYGRNKKYLGVAANLVAFTCKKSFDLGYDGYVAFTAKTSLVGHYKDTLGAELLYGKERMGIFTKSAKKLVNSYYKNYFGG